MHDTVRNWIADVLRRNPGPVLIAMRQRAKFEGWLKFELAAHAERYGKLASGDRELLVAFVMFPIPSGDQRWHEYLERVGRELQISLSPKLYAVQVALPISSQHSADVAICCFPVPRR